MEVHGGRVVHLFILLLKVAGVYASFQINESSMQRVGNLTGELGLDTFEDTLSDINGFRILSSTLGYGAIGDEFYGVVGMDNIQLITIPEPSFIASLFTILVLPFF